MPQTPAKAGGCVDEMRLTKSLSIILSMAGRCRQPENQDIETGKAENGRFFITIVMQNPE
jgi:hypothetical protein